MIFKETELPGAFLIEPEPHWDERGFFARTFCQREFECQGLAFSFVQSNLCFNRHRGTLRGLHYQTTPHAEAKLVRCTAGAIYDVILDLRLGSPTRGRWAAMELSAESYRMLYVPKGLAHGFLTLHEDTEVFYEMSEFYTPETVRGIRWDDPAFAVRWPMVPTLLSPRDRSFPDFDGSSFEDEPA